MADMIGRNPIEELNRWIGNTGDWQRRSSDTEVENSLNIAAQKRAQQERTRMLAKDRAGRIAAREAQEAANDKYNNMAGSLGSLAATGWDRMAPVSADELVQLRTGSGNVTVNKRAASDFQGFLDDIEKRGYDVGSLGGYNPRKARDSDLWSMHSGGFAIDIDPGKNPHYRTPQGGKHATPTWMVNLGRKYNMYWGGNWKNSKDYMHWSWKYSG